MFNTLLKKLRAKNNVTQGQLAKEIGVSPGNVGDWETGKSKPSYTALYELARFFEVSADYLLELVDVPDTYENTLDFTSYKKKEGLTGNSSPLTDEEADIVAIYRLLPEIQKEDAYDMLQFKYLKFVEKTYKSNFQKKSTN